MDIEQIITYFKSNSNTPFILIQPLQTELPNQSHSNPAYILAAHNTNFTATNNNHGQSCHIETETTPVLKIKFQHHSTENIWLPQYELERHSSHLILPQFQPELCIGEANIRGYSNNQYGKYYKLVAPVINQFLRL